MIAIARLIAPVFRISPITGLVSYGVGVSRPPEERGDSRGNLRSVRGEFQLTAAE